MSLGTQLGLGSGDILLDGDPALPPPKKGAQAPLFGPCTLWALAKRLDGSRCHSVRT